MYCIAFYMYFQNKYGVFRFYDASSWFQAEVIAVKLWRAVKVQHETGIGAPALPLRSCCEGVARLSRSSGDAVTKASRSRCEAVANWFQHYYSVFEKLWPLNMWRSRCGAIARLRKCLMPLRCYCEAVTGCWNVGCEAAKRALRLCRCGDAVSCMRSHSYGCKL